MQHKNYQDMDIQELYTNSYRLVSQMTTDRKRYLYNQLPWETRMLCIRGARGVGKTTLLLQRIAEAFPAGSNQALYVSLDELWFNENRLIDLAEYHYTHGGTHLFLDEVHRYPQDSWAQEIKNIYDRYPGLLHSIKFWAIMLIWLWRLPVKCMYYSILRNTCAMGIILSIMS